MGRNEPRPFATNTVWVDEEMSRRTRRYLVDVANLRVACERLCVGLPTLLSARDRGRMLAKTRDDFLAKLTREEAALRARVAS